MLRGILKASPAAKFLFFLRITRTIRLKCLMDTRRSAFDIAQHWFRSLLYILIALIEVKRISICESNDIARLPFISNSLI